MTRDEAFIILQKYMKNPNLLKHSLAAEAAMKGIYHYLYAEKPEYNQQILEMWGITGLLHDVDYEMAKDTPELHGTLIFDKKLEAFPPEIEYAIKAHNFEGTKVMPQTPMDWAITCCDQLTGLIVAATLVHPDKKLAVMTPEFILKRFNEKSFAKGADRKMIQFCEEKLGISLAQFVVITLSAMQGISNDLGL